jgi:hypothetical protein
MKITLNSEVVWHDMAMASDVKSASAAITRYYDSLSDEEQQEAQLWGKFAESQLPQESDELV